MKKIFKSKKGFTLIELIVVIAILAVLAMLALPTFNGLIDDSKVQVANANARTAYTAVKAYQALNPTVTDLSHADTIEAIEDLLDDEINITAITVEGKKITVKISDLNGKTGTFTK